MYANILSYAPFGMDIYPVRIEAAVSPGLPRFDLVGLPDTAIRESKERVTESFRACGYEFPPGQVTVNLAPAGLKKKGASLDLPIALAVLAASKQIDLNENVKNCLISGELSLEGKVLRTENLFNAGLYAHKNGIKKILFPTGVDDVLEYFHNLEKLPVSDLKEAVEILKNGKNRPATIKKYKNPYRNTTPAKGHISGSQSNENTADFADIFGQETVKKGIMLSLIGRLNILLVGPPGCGKSMALRGMKKLMPVLDEPQRFETSSIYAAAGLLQNSLIKKSPFREVQHTITEAALFGGGEIPCPGEISLAHNGVLFMDEFAEYNRPVIQKLRVPLEKHYALIQRRRYSYRFPAHFILAAASNPCPCGYYGDHEKMCVCSESKLRSYYSRLSGPVLDRIDLIFYLQRPDQKHLFKKSPTSTAVMKERISETLNQYPDPEERLSPKAVSAFIENHSIVRSIFQKAYKSGIISLRRLHAAARIIITLSMLDNCKVTEDTVYEALSYSSVKWKNSFE